MMSEKKLSLCLPLLALLGCQGIDQSKVKSETQSCQSELRSASDFASKKYDRKITVSSARECDALLRLDSIFSTLDEHDLDLFEEIFVEDRASGDFIRVEDGIVSLNLSVETKASEVETNFAQYQADLVLYHKSKTTMRKAFGLATNSLLRFGFINKMDELSAINSSLEKALGLAKKFRSIANWNGGQLLVILRKGDRLSTDVKFTPEQDRETRVLELGLNAGETALNAFLSTLQVSEERHYEARNVAKQFSAKTGTTIYVNHLVTNESLAMLKEVSSLLKFAAEKIALPLKVSFHPGGELYSAIQNGNLEIEISPTMTVDAVKSELRKIIKAYGSGN